MEVLFIKTDVKINEKIRESQIRLVQDGESRVINTKEALELAKEMDLDLVMVSPEAKPPVCKLMDYNKYLYEKAKKAKEAKKKQKIIEIKEIRLSPTIEEHDIEIKANNAKRFLKDENKVKVSIRFRGRQNNYTSMGAKVFDKFLSKVDELAVVEKAAQLEGKNMFMIIAPKKVENR
ncbi:MAG: translation initiation factor IF-3 [Clostridiales bacterium]|nr:translation initiation factor IF-3 [Clostridiales bacterium]